MVTGKEMLEFLDVLYTEGTGIEDLLISSIEQDTRKVTEGTCFVCIKGACVDGHDLVQAAIDNGAVMIISERPLISSVPVAIVSSTKKALAQLSSLFYQEPSRKIKMIGVTGTNGKTTITHLIAAILSNLQSETGIIGTMYAKYRNTIVPTINTTPDALTLQKILAEMNDNQIENCAMEVSSHALVQGRVWGVDFNTAVFTNLSQDHLEYHHTMDEYFYAKSLLFSQLGNTYDENKKAVINIDDPYGEKLLQLTAQNVLTYGCSEKAMMRAVNIDVTSTGTTFDLCFAGNTYPVSMKMIGDFNVYNALASIAACYCQGYAVEKIVPELSKITGVKGRFELVPNHKNITVIVDYAHTPDGLLNVLETAQKFARGKIFCVVGCGGDRDPSKRSVMADIAVAHADVSIFTSDNPRTEDPEMILDEMTEHLAKDQYQRHVDRKEAIHEALSQACESDVVLIAGKGHENYQIIGTTKHHFDDVEIVQEYFLKNQ